MERIGELHIKSNCNVLADGPRTTIHLTTSSPGVDELIIEIEIRDQNNKAVFVFLNLPI